MAFNLSEYPACERGLQFFDSNSYAVPGFYSVTFGNINVKPQSIRIVLGRILGHQAILVVIDISNEFYLRFKLKKFCHNKRRNEWAVN